MNHYIKWVIRHPIVAISACVMLTAWLSLGIFKLKFDTSIESFLPKQDAEYMFYNQVKDVYGDSDIFIVLAVSSDDLWSHQSFRQINNLLSDLEAYDTYDSDREASRLSRFKELMATAPIRFAHLEAAFRDDPAFIRLVIRKLGSAPTADTMFEIDRLQRLYNRLLAANALKQREMIAEIISPFTLRDIAGTSDTLESVRLIETDENGRRLLPETPEDFAAFRKRMERNPAFEKGIYARNSRSSQITDLGFIVQFKNAPNHDAIAREILEIANSYHNSLHIIPQGQPLVYIWINDYMRTDLLKLIPLVMLVTVIIFYINFRSFRGVILPFFTLNMATCCLLGLMGHLGVHMTTVGVSLPVLMIAVGSSYSIHILNQYYADFNLITRKGAAEGLQLSLSHISVTVLLAGLTTFVAFLTLASHQLSAIREWGVFSAVGVCFAVLISVTFIPAGLALMPHKRPAMRCRDTREPRVAMVDRIIAAMTAGATIHYRKVLATVAVALAFSIVGLFRLEVETEFLQYFKKNNFIRTSAGVIGEKFGGRWGFNILIDSGEMDGAKSARFLRTVTEVRQWLEADRNRDLNIGRTDAFSDYVKTMHMAMNNDQRAYYAIPDSDMDILDYLEIYADDDDNSDGRMDCFERYVDPDFQTCNILARLCQKEGYPIGTAHLKRIFTKIAGYLADHLPSGYSFRITGHPSMLIKSADYIVAGQVQSLALSLVVIGVVVVFLLKNIKAGLLSLIPMTVAVTMNFGIMGWFGIRLDIATSIIAAITIGIGVDDTIHFINTFRHFQEKGLSIDETIRQTLEVSGKAILFTSLALIFGFSVLGISTFKPLILFGLLMAITMIATTIGALLVLPAMIKITGLTIDSTHKGVSHRWIPVPLRIQIGFRKGQSKQSASLPVRGMK